MTESSGNLQINLDKFGEYCRLWKLKVNVEKTKIIIFGKGRQPENLHFWLGGNEIEIVKEFNYLGVVFSRTGNFNKAIKMQAEKAKKAMYEVLKRGRTHNLSIICQLELFDKIVKPILLYGSEIWGFSKNIDCLEKVHLRFCKLLLKLKTSTPNYMVYGELGRYPLEVDIKLRMVSFWGRLLTGKESKLSFISYKLIRFLLEDNADVMWPKYVKKIFDDTGFSYIWNFEIFQNQNWLINNIKLRLLDQFKQVWHDTVENSPKALNYRLFKHSLEFENYLSLLEDRDVFTLCKFRTTNNHLPVETGRWNQIERENRICTFCDARDIGDEFHYIMQCKHFSNYRKTLFKNTLIHRPNILKFAQIMSATNKKELQNLCKFIRIINNCFAL